MDVYDEVDRRETDAGDLTWALSNALAISGQDKLPASVFTCPISPVLITCGRFLLCMLALERASLGLPSQVGPWLSEEQWAPVVTSFCLWLSPRASLACHAKPQHPGDGDNCGALPPGQSRVLVDAEPGKCSA